MSVTYTDTYADPSIDAGQDDAFVPSYARGARRRKPVRTWMILAPIGALALIGGGSVMMLGGEGDAAPLAEAEPTVAQPIITPPTPLESSTVAPIVEAAPAVVSPAAEAAPPPVTQRRQVSAPAARSVAPAVAPRVETAPEPAGPQPYSASGTASPAPAEAAPPAPAISVSPLG